MTDPPDTDGEVPERFLRLIDEILVSESFRNPPSLSAERRARSGPARRVVVYAAVAAAVVAVAFFGLAALPDADITSVDTQRATSIPSPAATSEAAGERIAAQIAADALIAAEHGLTLGRPVFGPNGAFVLADQPDLISVEQLGEIVGYAHRGDFDPTNETPRFVVFDPDGVAVRGVFDKREGFSASTDPSEDQGD